MSLTLRSAVLALSFAVALVGCGAQPEPGSPDNRGVPGVDASLSFAHEGTLTMAPGEVAEVVVKGTPPAPYAMTFFLSGESGEASLDKHKVVAGKDGVATVRLRAPNNATSFELRATIKDGPSADLTVAVSDQGFGDLLIEPVYHGTRPIDAWQAHVLTGSCESLAEELPEIPAGALEASAGPEQELLVQDAPVGPNLAVIVVAGGYAWGCSDEAELVASSTTEVSVAVTNKPVVLDELSLDLELEFSPEQPAWDNLLAAETAAFQDAFFGSVQDQADTLLNAMEAVSGDPMAFNAASVSNDWKTAVSLHLTDNTVDLQAMIASLSEAGLMAQQPLLNGHLTDIHDTGAYGTFEWLNVGNVDAAQLAVETEYTMTITVDPDDTVRLGVELQVLPSQFIGAAIEQAALQQYPNSSDAVAVLAEVAQCDTLQLKGLTGCNNACIAQLCRDALQSMWSDGLEASSSNYGMAVLPMQVSGAAMLDNEARLTGFEGTWLGSLQAGNNAVTITGAAMAATESPIAR